MENIIAIRNASTKQANEAFADFMAKTEYVLNEEAKRVPSAFRKLNGTPMEDKALSVLREVAPSTPFPPDDIILVSGHKFPDIIANRYYGVEVKTTKDDNWRSTGSSIVESTRVDDVENIYMLFGKLGGAVPQFRCKPYESCLYDIAVTHSPRYLIDMDLPKGQTIFDQMGISYDELRNNEHSVDKVRDFYRQKAKAKGVHEMPWWLGTEREENVSSPVLRMWGNLTSAEKGRIQAEMLVLFPGVIRREYDIAVMWLCAKHSVVCHCFRDMWTAGGRFDTLVDTKGDEKKLEWTIPKIIGTILELKDDVDGIRCSPNDLLLDILEYRPALTNSHDWVDSWLCETNDIINGLIVENGVGEKKPFFEVYGKDTFKKWFVEGYRLIKQ
ncbi:MAG: hypothetical protein MJZ86_04180 [Bacteroidales bacterium]|nr:hypothetical protein [Bacteroidales bacterium]